MLMTFSHCVLISPRNYVCDVCVCVCPLGGCSHWLVCLSAYTHKINPPILAFCPLFFCALWLFLCFYFGNIISFGPPRFHLLYALFFEWCVIVHTCNCLDAACVCVCAFFFGCSWFWWTQFSLLLRLAWNLLLFLLWYLRLSLCVWTCCCLTVVIYIILNWNLGCCSFFCALLL